MLDLIAVRNCLPTYDLQTQNNVSGHGINHYSARAKQIVPTGAYICFLTAYYRAPATCYVYADTCMVSPLLQLSKTVVLSCTNVPLQNLFCYDTNADAARQRNLVGELYVHTTVK